MSILDERAAKAIQEAMDARVRALSVKSATSHMAEVIEIDAEGVTWVHIFGGADRTPAIRTLAKVKKGDLVTVTIEEGVVTITGSPSSPSASIEYVDAANYEIASYAKEAIAGILGDVIQVKNAIIERATIEDLTAVEATIETLTADYANLNELVAGKATISDLTAATGRISQLEADNVTVNGKITAAEGRIGTIESDYLKTQDMDAEVARVGTLLAGYAEADLANVNNAWIENGVIKDAAITNEMVGSLSANKLTAGTINGANINVTNLKADNITTGTLNGERIGQGSLSLDKLSEDVYTETEVDAIVEGLNDRIDGAIETHTGTVVPTLNNSPASAWNTADLKDEHVGDVYYVVNSQSQQNGYCYRFTKSGSTYSWQLIKDSDVTAALSRLQTAEGKITTFDSDISTLKTDTGELKTKTQTLETSLGDKVDTATFNELSSTVDGNSATITSMSTVLTNNGLTSSTNITQTVNSVSQTATSNSSTISQLVTTLGTNADGTTKAGDIVHRTSAVEQDLSGFKTTVSQNYASKTSVEDARADATKALGRQVAYSATCSTAAGTAAKVATCTNFPTLAAGVTVTVRFSAANTSAGAITLNVNSTGAKTIYVNGAATAAGNQMLWASNANVTFTYDGTYWRVVSEPRTWYGTCATAAGTAAKAATINEVVVCKGTVVKLNMTYENTSTSATLNLTSTGAKNLYYGTTATRPTTANGYGWGAASTATFVFDGQYWRVGDTSVLSRLIQAETTISSHTTSINQNAESIALKADATDVYTKTQTDGLISTEVTNRNAAITAKANEITSSVSETYATKSTVNGIEGRVTTAESTITQHATDIEAKVSKDGVIAAINVSVEQSGGSVAKISADKVNIEGATIFSSGRLSQSSLDNAYDAKGAATTAEANAKAYTDDAVDNIDVGGRNLILGTADAISTSDKLTTLSISNAANELASDDDVTLTFYASASESIWIDFYWYTTSGSTWNPFYPAFNLTTDRTRYSVTLKAGGSAAKATSIRLRKSTSSHGSSSATGTIYVDSLKLERGNIATDWTPAPEDLEAYADAAVGEANDEEQTIFIQASAGVTTATPPSAWVEETGESTYLVDEGGSEAWSAPVWTVKPPTFSSEYPVTLVAKQRKSMDGTVTCTTSLIDDTTTVIDGGRIITGSVTANAIDATDLHVSAANVDGTLTASQIDTEGLELNISAVTGLGDELAGISDQVNSKASSEDFESLSATVGSMSGTVEAALGEGGDLEKLRNDIDTIQAHISLGTIGEGSSLQPAITLDAEGGSSSGFKNVITNTSMSFMYGDETVAEVNKDELDITRTKVTESMQLGNFMWIPLSDGSLAFKWVEE